MNRPTDERGQILSSLVAVLAVVAIVGGLLVLFGTRAKDSGAAEPSAQSSTPKPTPRPASIPGSAPTSVSTPTETPTTAPTTTSGPTEARTSVPTPSVTLPPTERPAAEIYNNTDRKGLAQDVANRARQAGWTVRGADNWHGKIVASTVYYPAGMQAEAAQLAQDLGVNRIKEALSNMKKDRLTVILTSDYAG
ncbi:LytR cell envelope-related transcriptional attenuator [Kribbella sp. VKM Ac-2527]|uniref:LytR cell envelope-related transcriptional attenuator n=1 Tax=Kribbella caucasensis TaxID=2512215 RepID=A0A4V3C754_9ACTN|nr:LytR C-terminal domain-containing protein [Kribbella sp. VKM Ac-2527]TDO36358.1 LytR cell envelope-related transcriptional attenuator [Kribbella sp. VKM Ac-2527]